VRGLTSEEAEHLRFLLVPAEFRPVSFDYAVDPWAKTRASLEARGCMVTDYDVRLPDGASRRFSGRILPLGRLALACHAAASALGGAR
jgi:hypothetical protein